MVRLGGGFFLVGLFVFVLVPSAAHAGTPEDPEIKDPAGDALPPVSATVGAADALDLVAVWIAEDGAEFAVHWKLKATKPSGPADRFEYGLTWVTNDQRMTAMVWRQRGDVVKDGGLWQAGTPRPCAHTSGSLGIPATLTLDDAQSVIRLSLPRDCLTVGDASGLAANVTMGTFSAYTRQCVMTPMQTCYADTVSDRGTGSRPFVFRANVSVEEETKNTTMLPEPKGGPATPGLGFVGWVAAGIAALVAARRRG